MSAGQSTIHRSMNSGEWGLLVLLSVLWGGSFFFVEVALQGVPPLTLVFLRVGIGAAALLAVMRFTGARLPRGLAAWRAFFVMGLLSNAIPFSLIAWGQTQLTGGLAAVLNAMTPIVGAVLAHFLTSDEKLSANRVVGLALGLAGVAVMMGPAALAGLGAMVLAQAAVLGATVSYAVASIFGRRAFAAYPPLIPATGQLVCSALVMLPVALLFDRPWTLPVPSLDAVGAFIGLGVVSTAAAFLIYFRMLKTAGATNLMLVTMLIPVSAILLGAAFLGEALEPREIGGMALIALGLVAIDGRLGFRR